MSASFLMSIALSSSADFPTELHSLSLSLPPPFVFFLDLIIARLWIVEDEIHSCPAFIHSPCLAKQLIPIISWCLNLVSAWEADHRLPVLACIPAYQILSSRESLRVNTCLALLLCNSLLWMIVGAAAFQFCCLRLLFIIVSKLSIVDILISYNLKCLRRRVRQNSMLEQPDFSSRPVLSIFPSPFLNCCLISSVL